MNVGVIGLGSMGKRRIRLIKENFPEVNVVGIDNNLERCGEVEELFDIETLSDSDEFFNNYSADAVFISTSPLSHSKLITKALKSNLHVFTEINLVNDDYDLNINLANENDLILFLSSTQLYRREINFIDEIIKKSSQITNYIYHIGNYLPDWHPWESYKNFFISDKRTNGCREILAIELPWIVNTFGEIDKVYVSKNKISELDIDYPDSFFINISHKNGSTGSLIVDLVARNPVRYLEIINENNHILWDGTPQGLEKYDFDSKTMINVDLYDNFSNKEGYNKTIIENAYLDEIKDFFNSIKTKSEGLYSFKKDKYVLDIIDAIEDNDCDFHEF